MAERTPAEILRAARELLSDEANWGQGAYFEWELDRYCLAGACAVAAGRDPADLVDWLTPRHFIPDAVMTALREAICEATGQISASIAPFNDAGERTHAEILAVLDRAIALAEAAP